MRDLQGKCCLPDTGRPRHDRNRHAEHRFGPFPRQRAVQSLDKLGSADEVRDGRGKL